MGRLTYSMNVSVDGYAAGPDGDLGWSTVDEEIHQWWNDRIREASAYLYGRKIWDVMSAYWPTAESDPNAGPVEREFGRIWTAAPKVVFSSTLETVDWNARLERRRIEDIIDTLRDEFDGEIDVAGPTLAAPLVRRGLIDAYRVVVHPVAIGAGLPFFPDLEQPLGLRLFETKTFQSGLVYLGYEPAR